VGGSSNTRAGDLGEFAARSGGGDLDRLGWLNIVEGGVEDRRLEATRAPLVLRTG
jgi:hypothetical protein